MRALIFIRSGVSGVVLLLMGAVALADPPSCGTAQTLCCNSFASQVPAGVAALLLPLGINISSVTSPIGLECVAIDLMGPNGDSCTTQILCCTNVLIPGIIAEGCSPLPI